MSIQAIPRPEFERLLPLNPALEGIMIEQVEWFSNRSGHLLGAIAKGSGYSGWNYAIVNRERRGGFRVRKVMGNFFNLKAARVDLLLSMTGIEKPGSAAWVTQQQIRPPNFTGPSLEVPTVHRHNQAQQAIAGQQE